MPTILAVQSNPDDTVRLALDLEIREIRNAITPPARRELKIVQAGAVRMKDIAKELFEHKPDIFHFCGHGTTSGELVLQDDNLRSQVVSNSAIETLFSMIGEHVKCVILSACFSDTQAKRIARYVPYVIGNSEPVSDDTALEFSKQFYQALSNGKTVSQSFAIARNILTETDQSFGKIPKLYKGPTKDNWDGILFRRPVVKACFELSKNGIPREDSAGYIIKFWVENLPVTVISVVYNFNHKTVIEKFKEMENDGAGVDVHRRFYGTLQLRVTIWYNTEGDGLVTTVYDALMKYYERKRISSPVKKALDYIKNH